MSTLDFLPPGITARDYISNCWHEDSYFNDNTKSQPTVVNGSKATVDLESFNVLYHTILSTLPEFIGFCFYTLIFGISLIVSILSLHYLIKKWKKTPSHLIVATFTFVISAYNIALFGISAAAMTANIAGLLCPLQQQVRLLDAGLQPVDRIDWTSPELWDSVISVSYESLFIAAIPTFVWITDAFLLYRAWAIWVHHRKYITVPALAFLASVACGIAFLNLSVVNFRVGVFNWTLALSFSCGLDAITTGMITGRLIHHHRKQKKLTEGQSTFYLPIVAIFIESAALSLIAKLLQLTIPTLEKSLIVLPVCTISSNLIVLRNVLGADASQMLAKAPEDLSPLRIRRCHCHSEPQSNQTGGFSIPGGFGSHLIQTIGGQTVRINTFNDDAETCRQSSISDVPKGIGL